MVRKALIFAFSLIMLLISAILLYTQAISIDGRQNNDVDNALKEIVNDLNRYKGIHKNTYKRFRKNLFFVIWMQNRKKEWLPIVSDGQEDYFVQNKENPQVIPPVLTGKARKYETTIGDINFTVWVNKKNVRYIGEFILLPFFLLLIIYLIVMLFIIIIFNPSKDLIYDEEIEQEESYEEDDESDTLERELKDMPEKSDGSQKTGKTDEKTERDEKNAPLSSGTGTEDKKKESEDAGELEEVTPDETGQNGVPAGIGTSEGANVLEEYRTLWGKSFKISDSFKKSFPFDEIYGQIRFRTEPEEYLTNCLIIASEFFMWTHPALFIRQEDRYINIETKEQLQLNSVAIPAAGSVKGPVYLPVFADEVSDSEPLGYFYFEWHENEAFSIADILFLLKQIFSPDARSLFVNQTKNQKKYEEISHLYNQDHNIFIGFLKVDAKEKIMLKVSPAIYEDLNDMIYEGLFKKFKEFNVFEVVPYYYGIFGRCSTIYDSLKEELSTFCSDEELHNYEVSKQYGNIAVTLSGGVGTHSTRNKDVARIITASEENLFRALKQGGDQVIFD